MGVKREKRRYPVVIGLCLCLAALALSAALQQTGYLAYLDSDIAAELLLARRQAQTGSLVQMDWLYSTEIRILGPNLLYALAFLFDAGCRTARIVGNTLGLALLMGACAFLLRRARIGWGGALAASALLGAALSRVYAYAMTVGGFYLFHGIFGFLSVGLWIQAAEGARGRGLLPAAAYAALCMLMGFLSVRYVLCFVCPMMAVAAMDVLLAPQTGYSLRDEHMRFGGVTAAGFAACLAGYGAAEILLPRLFHSGAGAAGSFRFNPLDGQAVLDTLAAVAADFLELLGWRGEAALFSAAGVVNLCIAGVVFLGAVMTVRVYRALSAQDGAQRRQRRLMQAAFAAFGVNLFCFVFIWGTYLNRYLILAVLLFVPALAVTLRREKSLRLRAAFLLLLCVQMGLGSALMLRETRVQSEDAAARSADLMDAAGALTDAGYTHGYGTFWNVRVLEERTQGALTFTGVSLAQTEEGALCPVSPEMIRWLEPDDASHLDACPGRTFLLLTRAEEESLTPWLETTGAPRIYENAGYCAYGFDSSQAFSTWALLGSMKLENARLEDGVFVMEPGGRMRVPTAYREAGSYALRFDCEGEPAQDSVVQVYTGRTFELLAEQRMALGSNELPFALEEDDKYFMILLRSGGAQRLGVSGLALEKAQP